MENLEQFNTKQIEYINNAVEMAEELVSNYYKMSINQWLRLKYDIKTLNELFQNEIIFGPFAQIIRYEGKLGKIPLSSSTYDFYKICLQDHTILAVLNQSTSLQFFPFILYIVTHELVHIVRFSKFLQNFEASLPERFEEEKRVHEITREILNMVKISGLEEVLNFYNSWRIEFDGVQNLD